ncbi:MAG: T9SS type A sorting domain-containing protein [Bacteroidales bacterium]
MKRIFTTLFFLALLIQVGKSQYLVQTLDSVYYTQWRHDFFFYDSLGRNTEWLTKGIHQGSTFWSARHEYQYDTNNRLIVEIEDDCDVPFNGWYPYRKYTFHYDVDGKDSVIYTASWKASTMSYDVFGRSLFTYSAAGKPEEVVGSSWQGPSSTWAPRSKVTYAYDSNGYLSAETTYEYSNSLNDWEPYYRMLYTRNAQGQVLVGMYQDWKWGYYPNMWNNIYRDIYGYDAFGNIVEVVSSDFEPLYNQWTTSYKSEHLYDLSMQAKKLLLPVPVEKGTFNSREFSFRVNKPTVILGYNYIQNNWVPTGDSVVYFYSDFNIGMNKINADQNLHIYPNPTTGILNVNGLPAVSGLFEVTVFDLSGKNICSSNFADNKIDLSFLPSGMYILEIKSKENNQFFRQKLIKQ